MTGTAKLLDGPLVKQTMQLPVLAMDETPDIPVNLHATNAARGPVALAKQPVLVAKARGVQGAVGALEHDFQPQTLAREPLHSVTVPGQPEQVRHPCFLSGRDGKVVPLGDTETET